MLLPNVMSYASTMYLFSNFLIHWYAQKPSFQYGPSQVFVVSAVHYLYQCCTPENKSIFSKYCIASFFYGRNFRVNCQKTYFCGKHFCKLHELSLLKPLNMTSNTYNLRTVATWTPWLTCTHVYRNVSSTAIGTFFPSSKRETTSTIPSLLPCATIHDAVVVLGDHTCRQ